jgi:hypothetical protein
LGVFDTTRELIETGSNTIESLKEHLKYDPKSSSRTPFVQSVVRSATEFLETSPGKEKFSAMLKLAGDQEHLKGDGVLDADAANSQISLDLGALSRDSVTGLFDLIYRSKSFARGEVASHAAISLT